METCATLRATEEPSVFHLHPLLRCNLRCLHCYSNSSPHAADILSAAQALAGVELAAAWGYRRLAVSGGEPLLYPDLDRVLRHAASLGMACSVVTNGLLLTPASIKTYLRGAGAVVVSVDGMAASHERIRGRKGAFVAAGDAVRRLVDAGIPTSVACGVLAANLDELEELVICARYWGARSIHFHAIDRSGRAALLPASDLLNHQQRLRLFVTVNLLALSYGGDIEVSVDLMHRRAAQLHDNAFCAADMRAGSLPAAWLAVLVMYADGRLGPACHGLARTFDVGWIAPDGAVNGDRIWRAFCASGYARLRDLGRQLLAELQNRPEPQVFNPGEWLAERSLALVDAAA